MITKLRIPVLLLILLPLTLLSCRRHQQENNKAVKVGVILPLSGTLAEMGQYEKQAMELGIEDLKRSGQSDIQLIFEDGRGDNKVVAAAANKLLDVDRVSTLITSTTGASLAARPIADRKGIPLLAFCMGSDVAPESANTIRFYIGIEEETKAIISYLSTLPVEKRVGVLHASVAVWKTAVKDIYEPFFKQRFSEPVLIEEYPITDKDFRSQLLKLKQGGVRTLILLGYGFEYGPLFTQMEELRMKDDLQIVGGWGFLYTGLSSQTVEGIHVAGPMYVFNRDVSGSAFESDFQKRYGRPPNFDAAFAYELMLRMPDILQITQHSPRSDWKNLLSNKGEIKGVVGSYHFAPDGNMIVQTALGIFRNGQIVGEEAKASPPQ